MAEGMDGAIYVGVLPDLRGFDEKLRTQARKSGLKFGDEFAGAFDAALGPQMRDDVRKAVTTATKASPPVGVKAKLDTVEAQAKLQQFSAQKAEVTAKVTASTKQAQVDIDRLTKQQAKLQVNVDANDAEAKAKLDALEERKVAIQAKVDADTAGAIAKLAELDRKIHQVDNRHVKIDADTSSADVSLGDMIRTTDRAVGSAGGLAGALAAIGPAAVPSLLAAAAGAVALGAALGGAATVSLGTGLLAFSGLGDAVKALNDQESTAARTAAQASNATAQLAQRHLAAAGAADQLRQAQDGLKNAQLNAADAARSAAQRVQSAEDDLRSTQERSRQAQMDLTDARRTAAQQLEDLSDRLRDSALSEEEATLRVVQAKERLTKVRGDSKATDTDRREAELALERAQLTAEQQSKDLVRLRQEKAAADKAGVDGSKTVLDAQEKIAQANQAVESSEKSVADARYQQAQTARRNAYSVAQAQQSIVAAQRSIQSSALNMSKVAVPAIDKLRDAMENLSPAGRDFARFLFGLKPGLDDLRATAARGLLPGLEGSIRNLSPLMPVLKRGIRDVALAMGDAAGEFSKALTSPEVRRFLDDLFKTAPDSIRQLGILTGKAARALATIFDQATPAGKTLLADVVAGLDRFLDRISTPAGKRALAEFFADGVQIVESLGGLLGGVLDLFGALAGAGSATGPASGIEAITRALHGLASVIREHEGSGKVIAGIVLGFTALKVVGTILGPIATLARLIGGLGEVLGIGAAVEGGGIAGALGGIGTALAAIGPIGWVIIGVVAALTAGFVLAYKNSETFRRIVHKSIHAVGDAFQVVWKTLIRPAITAMRVEIDIAWAAIQVSFGLFKIGLKLLGDQFRALYEVVIKPVWERGIRPLLDAFGGWLDAHVIPKVAAAARILGGVFAGLADQWRAGLSLAIDAINKLLDGYNWLAHKFGVTPDDVHVNNPFRRGQQASTLNLSGSGGGGGRAPTKAAAGGLILGPGNGTSDSIPARLSNGEFVVRAGAVRALGVPFLDALNRSDGYRGRAGNGGRYADGGLVGDVVGALSDPLGFLGRRAHDLFKQLPNLGLLNGILNAIPQKLVSGMAGLLSGILGGGSSGGAGGGGSVGSSAITGSRDVLAIGQSMAAARGWTGAEWSALQQLWQHESGWNPRADNPTSTAFGIPQFLASTARAYGLSPGDTNPAHQIAAGLRYVADAYGDPINAWSKWQSRSPHWYDSGGWLMPGATMAMNGTGQPERVLTHKQYAAMSKAAVHSDRPTIVIQYPPHMPAEQALVDAQARADLLNF